MAFVRHIPGNLKNQLQSGGIRPSDLVLYINSSCNLRCKHCYVGDALLNAGVAYPCAEIIDFVNQFDHLDRLTIVGGEPLLHPEINDVVAALPYHKVDLVRLTTNLTTLARFDYERFVRGRVTICVSLDGHDAETHDRVRGDGAFQATIGNLERLLKLNYDIEITHTISNNNLHFFNKFVVLCRHLGVRQLNLHRVSLQGNAMSNSTLAVSPSQWVEFRDRLESMIASAKLRKPRERLNIHVRYPVLFATVSEFGELLRKGEYHHHVNGSFYGEGDRLVLYPDGRLYISSEAFGTEYFVGDISTGQLNWNTTGELALFRSGNADIAAMNSLQSGDENYPVVLSVSYKRSGFL
jgi:MoaA/NifB/PqqE/SkfB family radical SAM enzyme